MNRDYYPTPLSAINPLLNFLPPALKYFEPACGDGRIIKQMKDKGFDIEGTDIIYGNDFFKSKEKREAIITNPPFYCATEFVEHALLLSNNVIMLLRLSFLASKKRYNLFKYYPLTSLFVLVKRPSFVGKGTDNSEYGWFVWSNTIEKKGIFHLL